MSELQKLLLLLVGNPVVRVVAATELDCLMAHAGVDQKVRPILAAATMAVLDGELVRLAAHGAAHASAPASNPAASPATA